MNDGGTLGEVIHALRRQKQYGIIQVGAEAVQDHTGRCSRAGAEAVQDHTGRCSRAGSYRSSLDSLEDPNPNWICIQQLRNKNLGEIFCNMNQLLVYFF